MSNADLEKSWNDLFESSQDDSDRVSLLFEAARAWVDKVGVTALDRVAGSLEDSEERTSVLVRVLDRIADKHARAAFDFALTVDSERSDFLVSVAARRFAAVDPVAALEGLSKIGKSGMRRNLQNQLVQYWARNEPSTVLAQLDSLPLPAKVRGQAYSVALEHLAQETPVEAADIVSSMEEGSWKDQAAYSEVRSWYSTDPDATLEWALNDPGIESVRSGVVRRVLMQLAADDLEFAMKTALEQPLVAGESGPEAGIVSQLAIDDVATALEYLPMVREGQSTVEAYPAVGRGLVENGMTDEALNLLTEVPDVARERYEQQMFGAWAAYDTSGLVESLDRMRSEEIKSAAALILLMWEQSGNPLSRDHSELATSLLTDEDVKELSQYKSDRMP